jgi:SAM-dependent methyltransferase
MTGPATGFGDEARAYARWRPPYPPAVFAALSDRLEGRRALCVDLGAGSGQASLPLAALFDRVLAVDADARMLAELPPHPRVEPLRARAEDVELAAGSVDAVVAATAFHWMDQPAVLKLAHGWLRPGGAIFVFLNGPFEGLGPHAGVLRRRRALWRRGADPSPGARADYGAAIAASGLYRDVETLRFDASVELGAAEAAGLFMTTSYVRAAALAGPGPDAYAAALADELAAAGEPVRLRLPLAGAIARRPG